MFPLTWLKKIIPLLIYISRKDFLLKRKWSHTISHLVFCGFLPNGKKEENVLTRTMCLCVLQRKCLSLSWNNLNPWFDWSCSRIGVILKQEWLVDFEVTVRKCTATGLKNDINLYGIVLAVQQSVHWALSQFMHVRINWSSNHGTIPIKRLVLIPKSHTCYHCLLGIFYLYIFTECIVGATS